MFIDNLEYNPPVESLADARSAWFQLFKAQEAVLLSRRIGTDNGDRIATLLANLTTAEAASNKASDHLCRLIAASVQNRFERKAAAADLKMRLESIKAAAARRTA